MKLVYFFQLLFVFSFLFGCKENVKDLDYCFIHETDQSFVNTDKSDMVKFQEDKLKRAALIKQNFKDLIHYAEASGFPFVTTNMAMLDSCKYRAVTMTMIHAAQIQPEVFFSQKNIKLFKKELAKGNIRPELLKASIIALVKVYDICSTLKSRIEYALNEWEFKNSLIKDAKFINC